MGVDDDDCIAVAMIFQANTVLICANDTQQEQEHNSQTFLLFFFLAVLHSFAVPPFLEGLDGALTCFSVFHSRGNARPQGREDASGHFTLRRRRRKQCFPRVEGSSRLHRRRCPRFGLKMGIRMTPFNPPFAASTSALLARTPLPRPPPLPFTPPRLLHNTLTFFGVAYVNDDDDDSVRKKSSSTLTAASHRTCYAV